jgi:Domain of unknown function (DUF5134)
MIPSWILDIFAAIMLVVAAVSAARLVAARPWQHGARATPTDIDITHLLMAIAMAGMLVASLQTLPNGAWLVIFAVTTVWFGYRVIQDARVSGVRALAGGHCAPHLIHAGAMLYMFMAFTAPATHGSGGMSGGMSGMGTLQLPLLAFVFAVLLIGYSIWDLDQLSGPGASGHYSLAAARTVPTGPVLVGATAGPGAAVVSAPASGPVGSALATEAMATEALATEAVATEAVATEAMAADASAPASRADRSVLAPWVATGCRIAMGITMAFMLLIMI